MVKKIIFFFFFSTQKILRFGPEQVILDWDSLSASSSSSSIKSLPADILFCAAMGHLIASGGQFIADLGRMNLFFFFFFVLIPHIFLQVYG